LKDFTNKDLIYQIGIDPVRVDILMGMKNIEFDYSWKHRRITTFDNIKVNIIGIKELIKSKEKTKRFMDKIDVKNLYLKLKIEGKR